MRKWKKCLSTFKYRLAMPGANEKPCSQSIGSGWSDKWLGEINTLSEHQQGIFSRVRYHLYFYAKLPPGCTYCTYCQATSIPLPYHSVAIFWQLKCMFCSFFAVRPFTPSRSCVYSLYLLPFSRFLPSFLEAVSLFPCINIQTFGKQIQKSLSKGQHFVSIE